MLKVLLKRIAILKLLNLRELKFYSIFLNLFLLVECVSVYFSNTDATVGAFR